MVYNKNHILSIYFPDTIITTGSAVLDNKPLKKFFKKFATENPAQALYN